MTDLTISTLFFVGLLVFFCGIPFFIAGLNYLKIHRLTSYFDEKGFPICLTNNPVVFAREEPRKVKVQIPTPDHDFTAYALCTLNGGWTTKVSLHFPEDHEFSERWDIQEVWGHIHSWSPKSIDFPEQVEKLLTGGYDTSAGSRIKKSIIEQALEEADLSEIKSLPFEKNCFYGSEGTYIYGKSVHSEYLDMEIQASQRLTPNEYTSLILKKGGDITA